MTAAFEALYALSREHHQHSVPMHARPSRAVATSNLRADQSAVGDGATHARDQRHAAAGFQADHLASHRLGRHEDAGHIYTQHLLGIRRRVFQSRRLLLNAGCGNEPVQAAVLVGNTLDDSVEVVHVPNIHAVVC